MVSKLRISLFKIVTGSGIVACGLFSTVRGNAEAFDFFSTPRSMFDILPIPAEPTNLEPSSTTSGKPNYDVFELRPLVEQPKESPQELDIIEQKGIDFSKGTSNSKSLGELQLKDLAHIKSPAEACKELEGWIVTYYDRVSYVQKCEQRLIEDPEVFNELVRVQEKQVIEVPASIYRLIPFGDPFERDDLFYMRRSKDGTSETITKDECKRLNGSYITVSTMSYYFVEDCKRRPFRSFFDLQEHNREKLPILTLTPELLYKLPLGPELILKEADQESSVLYHIDGDVEWNRIAPNLKSDGSLEQDTLASLEKIDKNLQNPIVKATLCKRLDGKFISFYSTIYFIEKCEKHAVKDFSLEIQQQANKNGGVLDVTTAEYLAIPEGKPFVKPD